jgi:hypothetical protein
METFDLSIRLSQGEYGGVAGCNRFDFCVGKFLIADVLGLADSQSLSGNKAFIREDLRSYAWQGQERTYWIIGLLPYF